MALLNDPTQTPTEALIEEIKSHSVSPVDLSPDAMNFLILHWRDALLRLSYEERSNAELRDEVDNLKEKNTKLSVDVATLREMRKTVRYQIIFSVLAGLGGGFLASDPGNPLGYVILIAALALVAISFFHKKANGN